MHFTSRAFLLFVFSLDLILFALPRNLSVECGVVFTFLLIKSFEDACEHGCSFTADSLIQPQGIPTIIDILLSSEKITLKVVALESLVLG